MDALIDKEIDLLTIETQIQVQHLRVEEILSKFLLNLLQSYFVNTC